jgi:hypothetical protein
LDYVIGIFAEHSQIDHAIDHIKTAHVPYLDHAIKEYDASLKGWLERIFGMIEPLSTMQAQGVGHEDARWYADQMEVGRILLVVRTEQAAPTIGKMLQEAGAELVRLYNFEHGRWVRTLVDDISAPPPR